jgi:hypothetical protein
MEGKNEKETEPSQKRSLHFFTSVPIHPTQSMSRLPLAISSSLTGWRYQSLIASLANEVLHTVQEVSIDRLKE